MGESRARQVRRQRRQVDRRRAARESDAHDTQRKQAEAAARVDLLQRQRRHRLAVFLWVIAGVMAVAHFFEHTDTLRLMAPGLQDVLIGWPMAGVLAVVGAIVYGT